MTRTRADHWQVVIFDCPAIRKWKHETASFLLYCIHHELLSAWAGLMRRRFERLSKGRHWPKFPTRSAPEFGTLVPGLFFVGRFADARYHPPTSTSTSAVEHLTPIACTWTGHPGKLDISFYRRRIFIPR